MPKTGTSSLQFSLADYDDGDWAYAQVRMETRDVNHGAVVVLASQTQAESELQSGQLRPLDNRPCIFDRIKSATGAAPIVQDYRNALLGAFETSKDRNIILSGEAIFWEPSCLPGLNALLKRHFSEIKVVCYLRPLGELIVSRLQQWLRISDPHDFFEIPKVANETGLKELLQISAPLKALSAEFGAENLHVLPFSKSTLGNKGLVFDFMERHDLKHGAIKEIRANDGFSAEATAILFTLCVHSNVGATNENFKTSKFALNNLMQNFGHRSLGISDDLASKINWLNRSDVDWIIKQHAISVSAIGGKQDVCITSFRDLLDLGASQISAFRKHLQDHWDIAMPATGAGVGPFVNDLSAVLRRDLRGCVRQLPDGFDAATYLRMYEDVRLSGMAGREHFLRHGYFEGRLY